MSLPSVSNPFRYFMRADKIPIDSDLESKDSEIDFTQCKLANLQIATVLTAGKLYSLSVAMEEDRQNPVFVQAVRNHANFLQQAAKGWK